MIVFLCPGVEDPSVWEVREEIHAIKWAGRLMVALEEVEELALVGVEEVATKVRHNFMEVLHHTIQS